MLTRIWGAAEMMSRGRLAVRSGFSLVTFFCSERPFVDRAILSDKTQVRKSKTNGKWRRKRILTPSQILLLAVAEAIRLSAFDFDDSGPELHKAIMERKNVKCVGKDYWLFVMIFSTEFRLNFSPIK